MTLLNRALLAPTWRCSPVFHATTGPSGEMRTSKKTRFTASPDVTATLIRKNASLMRRAVMPVPQSDNMLQRLSNRFCVPVGQCSLRTGGQTFAEHFKDKDRQVIINGLPVAFEPGSVDGK